MSSHRSFIFGTCFRSSSVSKWIGLRAIDAEDRAVGRPDGHPLADEHLRVPAADGLDIKETVVVDVLDDQADLVAVARPASLAGGFAGFLAAMTLPCRSVRTSSAKSA